MPELPEAETIVRGLRRAILGETVHRVRIIHADVLRQSRAVFRRAVLGRTIRCVERRGKNVVIGLDEGVIAINLGMTGRPVPLPSASRRGHGPTHPAVTLTFSSGAVLVYDDVRRFGTVEALTGADWAERSARLGPEPLDPDFGPEAFETALGSSRAPIRSWLLDQKRIAGVGNIYANEALFLAGVHPRREAGKLNRDEAYALHGRIRDVLVNAIEAGGTTIRDYRNVDGEPGGFARHLRVYGRDGEACRACGDEVRRLVFANRSSFFCPTCQPEPRA